MSSFCYVNSDSVPGDLLCETCACDISGKDLRQSHFVLILIRAQPTIMTIDYLSFGCSFPGFSSAGVAGTGCWVANFLASGLLSAGLPASDLSLGGVSVADSTAADGVSLAGLPDAAASPVGSSGAEGRSVPGDSGLAGLIGTADANFCNCERFDPSSNRKFSSPIRRVTALSVTLATVPSKPPALKGCPGLRTVC